MRKVLFILGQLSDDDVEWLAKSGTREQVADSTWVIEEGKPVSSLYLLLDGHMSVTVKGVGEIARLGSGDILGEMSFIDHSPPAASVKALGSCRLLRLPRQMLDDHIARNPLFAAHFYKAIATFLSDRLRGTVSRLGFGIDGALQDEMMQDELDLSVLDNVHLAGARFDRLLKRLNG